VSISADVSEREWFIQRDERRKVYRFNFRASMIHDVTHASPAFI
jgi:hypothetical protein